MANSSAIMVVQDALTDILKADAALLTLCPDIKNFEPTDPPDRFIVVGNATERQWHTLGGKESGFGWHIELTVHIYSYYRGEFEALQILNRVTALLNQQPVSVSGYTGAMVEYAMPMTKVLTEIKEKRERRHIPAMFTVKVH